MGAAFYCCSRSASPPPMQNTLLRTTGKTLYGELDSSSDEDYFDDSSSGEYFTERTTAVGGHLYVEDALDVGDYTDILRRSESGDREAKLQLMEHMMQCTKALPSCRQAAIDAMHSETVESDLHESDSLESDSLEVESDSHGSHSPLKHTQLALELENAVVFLPEEVTSDESETKTTTDTKWFLGGSATDAVKREGIYLKAILKQKSGVTVERTRKYNATVDGGRSVVTFRSERMVFPLADYCYDDGVRDVVGGSISFALKKRAGDLLHTTKLAFATLPMQSMIDGGFIPRSGHWAQLYIAVFDMSNFELTRRRETAKRKKKRGKIRRKRIGCLKTRVRLQWSLKATSPFSLDLRLRPFQTGGKLTISVMGAVLGEASDRQWDFVSANEVLTAAVRQSSATEPSAAKLKHVRVSAVHKCDGVEVRKMTTAHASNGGGVIYIGEDLRFGVRTPLKASAKAIERSLNCELQPQVAAATRPELEKAPGCILLTVTQIQRGAVHLSDAFEFLGCCRIGIAALLACASLRPNGTETDFQMFAEPLFECLAPEQTKLLSKDKALEKRKWKQTGLLFWRCQIVTDS